MYGLWYANCPEISQTLCGEQELEALPEKRTAGHPALKVWTSKFKKKIIDACWWKISLPADRYKWKKATANVKFKNPDPNLITDIFIGNSTIKMNQYSYKKEKAQLPTDVYKLTTFDR